MSFIKFKSEPQVSKELKIQLNVVPIPKASDKYTAETKSKQLKDMAMIEAKGGDLFKTNPTKVSLNEDKMLYQSKRLYSKSLAVEDMLSMLTDSDLTIKVSALRDATSTCMELTSGKLADLVGQTADAKGDKIAKLSVAEGEVGEMFVAIKQYRGKHYIQKVDYEVDKEVDDKLHA